MCQRYLQRRAECIQPHWNLLGSSSAAERAGDGKKARLFSDNIYLVFISEDIWLLIYLCVSLFFICSLLACVLHRGLCVCVCVCWRQRAVFRNTKQRRRGRLDRGCIRLVSGGEPSGSLWEDRPVNIAARS